LAFFFELGLVTSLGVALFRIGQSTAPAVWSVRTTSSHSEMALRVFDDAMSRLLMTRSNSPD
jgi:hypothetical protein